ncbi:hypothetical protein SK128_017447 [Halocaridina rubra]|uniref:Uncharacterized protein n=1 Tax=Halocaridina rubra TaxID=373956 RepID=A0AAN9A4X1_HALRR
MGFCFLQNLSKVTCEGAKFKCTSSAQCIPYEWKCDGREECDDGSDEEGCPTDPSTISYCSSEQFRCEDNGYCISLSWQCDGEIDCTDGSDEDDCFITNTLRPREGIPTESLIQSTAVTTTEHSPRVTTTESPSPTTTVSSNCSEHQYSCQSDGRCIPHDWQCDGNFDCIDGSDEEVCDLRVPNASKTVPCPANKFDCGEGHCIRKCFVCDGERDCEDGRDEDGCTMTPILTTPPSDAARRCQENEFLCKSEGRCLYIKYQCDGSVDCADGSDENGCYLTITTITPPIPGQDGSGTEYDDSYYYDEENEADVTGDSKGGSLEGWMTIFERPGGLWGNLGETFSNDLRSRSEGGAKGGYSSSFTKTSSSGGSGAGYEGLIGVLGGSSTGYEGSYDVSRDSSKRYEGYRNTFGVPFDGVGLEGSSTEYEGYGSMLGVPLEGVSPDGSSNEDTDFYNAGLKRRSI